MMRTNPSAQPGQWSTDALPAGLRVPAAREMLNRTHLPWALDIDDRAAYRCRLAWQALGNCQLIECRSDPLAGSRGRSEIRRTEGDHIGLLLVLAGRERVRQGETASVLEAGDLLLWDGHRPLDFAVEAPLHKVTLLIPRDRLRTAAPRAEPRGAVRLDGRSGFGALTAGHLTALRRIACDIPVGDAPLAADLVVDLVGRQLDPTTGEAIGRAPAKSLVRAVLAHVEDRLADPALTPTAIAAAFDITPRYLHMVFAETGTTLAAHIRTRRLARVRQDLADPRMAARSVTEIVLRWGFNDPAHASRAFRRAYGQPPSRFRSGG